MPLVFLIYWLLGIYLISVDTVGQVNKTKLKYEDHIVDGEGKQNNCIFGVFGVNTDTGKGFFDHVRARVANLEGESMPSPQRVYDVRHESAEIFFDVLETGKVNLSTGSGDKVDIREYTYFSQLKQSCIVVHDMEIPSRGPGMFKVVDSSQFDCRRTHLDGYLLYTCICGYEHSMIDPGIQQEVLDKKEQEKNTGFAGAPIAEDENNRKQPGDVVLAYYFKTDQMDRKLQWDPKSKRCLSGENGHCTLPDENKRRKSQGKPIVECVPELHCEKTNESPIRSNGHLGSRVRPTYFGICSKPTKIKKAPKHTSSSHKLESFHHHYLSIWVIGSLYFSAIG